MKKIPNDVNKYPLHVLSHSLKRYIRSPLPSIVFFYDSHYPKSVLLKCLVTSISVKFPRVFCYKVGWRSHQNYFQQENPSNLLDVTVWQSLGKIAIKHDPNENELNQMFTYVHKLLFEKYRILYICTLHFETEKKAKLKEKRKLRKLLKNETSQTIVDDNLSLKSLQNVSEIFQTRSKEPYLNVEFCLNSPLKYSLSDLYVPSIYKNFHNQNLDMDNNSSIYSPTNSQYPSLSFDQSFRRTYAPDHLYENPLDRSFEKRETNILHNSHFEFPTEKHILNSYPYKINNSIPERNINADKFTLSCKDWSNKRLETIQPYLFSSTQTSPIPDFSTVENPRTKQTIPNMIFPQEKTSIGKYKQ